MEIGEMKESLERRGILFAAKALLLLPATRECPLPKPGFLRSA